MDWMVIAQDMGYCILIIAGLLALASVVWDYKQSGLLG